MSSCRWWRENEEMRRILLALGLGRLASFDFAILTFSASLVSAQVDAPLTMSVIPYAAMAGVYGSIMLYRRRKLLEYCVKRKDRLEVLSMMGVFGMLVSAVEIPVLERNNLATMQWSAGLLSAYAVCAVSSFLFSTLIPSVLKMSGAAFFCLSMLTSDMWAVVTRVFIYKQKVDWLYYLAFFLVVVGIFIYAKT